MAPHVPEEGGWTVVGRSRRKANGRARIAVPATSQPEHETGLGLVGWGAARTGSDGQGAAWGRKQSRRKQREKEEAGDEVAGLVEKVEGARLAIVASEFYRCFLETWQSQSLGTTLEPAADRVSSLHSEANFRKEVLAEHQFCGDQLEGINSTPAETTFPHTLEESPNRARTPGLVTASREMSSECHAQPSSASSKASSSQASSSLPSTGLHDLEQKLEHQDGIDTLGSSCKQADIGQLDIVVYGVGSISGSDTSRCQLAFSLLLRQLLPRTDRLLVFDPAFSEVDKQALERLGCDIISVNEEGRRSVNRPTLFYMPHCEEWMYDNLLGANRRAEQLRRVVILGNSFSSYHDRMALCSVEKRARMQYIKRVASLLEEVRIPDHDFYNASAFNDMSWHCFNTASKNDDVF